MTALTFDFDKSISLTPAGPVTMPGTFRGGPLEGLKPSPRVPEHGPAWVRYRDGEGFHWYAFKNGSKRTYTYVGVN